MPHSLVAEMLTTLAFKLNTNGLRDPKLRELYNFHAFQICEGVPYTTVYQLTRFSV